MTVKRTLIDELAFDLDHVRLRAATVRGSLPPSEDTAMLELVEGHLAWMSRLVRAMNEPPLDVASIGRDMVMAGLAELRLEGGLH